MPRKKPPTTHLVSGRQQLDAITSPIRLEIVESFEGGRKLTARDLGAMLERPVTSLYFHLNRLLQAGLLVEVGTRASGAREERLFSLVAERIAVPLNPRSRHSVDAVIRTVAAGLRQADRTFRQAIRERWIRPGDTRGDWLGIRVNARLSRAARKQIQTHLKAIATLFQAAERTRSGRRYAWTSLLVPLEPGDPP